MQKYNISEDGMPACINCAFRSYLRDAFKMLERQRDEMVNDLRNTYNLTGKLPSMKGFLYPFGGG